MPHAKTIAMSNQKGGVGKTVSTVSLGIKSPDELGTTVSTVMQSVIEEQPPPSGYGIISPLRAWTCCPPISSCQPLSWA